MKDKEPNLGTLLRSELDRRTRRNSSYSLRAFARAISYDPSSLSKILRGKRPIGKKLARKLGSQLGLDETTIESLTRKARRKSSAGNLTYDVLPLDVIELISDWYNNAILELMQVDGFLPDAGWIASQLEISPAEATSAVKRLVRLKMLDISDPLHWKDISSGAVTTIGAPLVTNQVLRASQEQLLMKAADALWDIPLAERDQSSLTLAFRREDLPEIRQRITDFRRGLDAFAIARPSKNSVYALSVSFFPLTANKESLCET